MIETRTRPTWEQLVKAEPALAALEREIKKVKPRGPHFCANDAWYGRYPYYPNFRREVIRLVGWERKSGPEFMQTAAAYDVAYRHLYDLLPPCRDCACL